MPKPVSSAERPDRARWVPLSINRSLVLDGLWFACGVPLFPVERSLDLAYVASLRQSAAIRVSWAALFTKAYSVVAAEHRQLRQAYVRWPWPHLIEMSSNVAMVVVNRQFQGDDRLCWGRLIRPEEASLADLQRQLTAYQEEPVERVFARQVRLSKAPAALRRIVWWFNLNLAGKNRARRMGTFTMSTLAGHGALNRNHQTALTTSLTYGPLDSHGQALVTLLCDHRVLDGALAARALAEMECVLNGSIARELEHLQSPRAAAG